MDLRIDYTPVTTDNQDPIHPFTHWMKFRKEELVGRESYSTATDSWFNLLINSPLAEHQAKGLKYKSVIQTDEDGGFVAFIPDLPGCITEGETIEETITFLLDALEGWMKVATEKNLEIPAPERTNNL